MWAVGCRSRRDVVNDVLLRAVWWTGGGGLSHKMHRDKGEDCVAGMVLVAYQERVKIL